MGSAGVVSINETSKDTGTRGGQPFPSLLVSAAEKLSGCDSYSAVFLALGSAGRCCPRWLRVTPLGAGEGRQGTAGQRASGVVSRPVNGSSTLWREMPKGWAGRAQGTAHSAPAPYLPHMVAPSCTQQRGFLLCWHKLRGREKVTLSSEKLVQGVEEKGDQTYVSRVSRDREVTRPVSRAL